MKSKKIFLSFLIVIVIIITCFVICIIFKSNNLKTKENIVGEVNSKDSVFINEQAFEYIKDCYNNIDFSSDFKQGDLKLYDFYKKQYLKLLNCEATFKVDDTGEEYFINEYGEMNYVNSNGQSTYNGFLGSYDPINYIYYFFDADNDTLPELCITDETRFIYIMKYNSDSDEFILWHEVPPSWIKLLGSRKLWLYSGTSPIHYAFFQLDQNGNIEFTIRYYIEQRNNQENNDIKTIYMLTLPEFSDNIENVEIPENIKRQSVEKDSHIYYRVTEDQWNELTKKFFEEKEASKENIKEVKFTYDKLFNSNYE